MNPPAGELRTPGGSVVRVARYPPDTAQPRHAHPHTSVSLVVRGKLEERAGRSVEVAGPLSVVVKPAGAEHADRFGRDGAVLLQLILSPEDEARGGEARDALGRWGWTHAASAARPLLSLLRTLRGVSDGRPEAIDDLLVEALAHLSTTQPAGSPPRWLLRAREALDEEATSTRRLAELSGVHPVHLAREFRRHFGASPSEHRRRGRLRRAARLLVDSDVTLAEAALAAGFADQAHMTREFRAAAGLTPRQLRWVTGSA